MALYKRFLSAALVLAMLLFLPDAVRVSAASLTRDDTIVCTNGSVVVTEGSYATADGADTVLRRTYSIPNGDRVTIGSYQPSASTNGYRLLEQYTCSGTSGTLCYYDLTTNAWVSKPLTSGYYKTNMVSIQIGLASYLFYIPQIYRQQASNNLELLSSVHGGLAVSQSGGVYTMTLYVPAMSAGCEADYTCVVAGGMLIDWSDSTVSDQMKNCTMDSKGKWCYDGYYYPAPDTYTPTGTNYFYRLPAAYLCRFLAQIASRSRGAADLSIAFLDTMCAQQNGYGYFPTQSLSQWLYGTYGIGAGFYDTRFNSDLMESFLLVYTRCGGDTFRAAMEEYADFYLSFSNEHHTTLSGGGWLVEDYWNPTGGTATHTSLNHQVEEAIILYQLSDALDRSELADRADQLVLAIKQTRDNWILGSSNLAYSRSIDGIFGGTDYPALTYNDLYRLQAILVARKGSADADIQILMDAKKVWMDANGVTSYLK